MVRKICNVESYMPEKRGLVTHINGSFRKSVFAKHYHLNLSIKNEIIFFPNVHGSSLHNRKPK